MFDVVHQRLTHSHEVPTQADSEINLERYKGKGI